MTAFLSSSDVSMLYASNLRNVLSKLYAIADFDREYVWRREKKDGNMQVKNIKQW